MSRNGRIAWWIRQLDRRPVTSPAASSNRRARRRGPSSAPRGGRASCWHRPLHADLQANLLNSLGGRVARSGVLLGKFAPLLQIALDHELKSVLDHHAGFTQCPPLGVYTRKVQNANDVPAIIFGKTVERCVVFGHLH